MEDAPETPLSISENWPAGLELTWLRAAKTFWSWMWRCVLVGAIVGLPLELLFAVAGIAQSVATNILNLVIMIPVSIWGLRSALRAKWSDFRIVLVPREGKL